MHRHATALVIISLILSAAILLMPVNAEDDAGPDTTGYDLNIDGFVTEFLDDPLGAVMMGPPMYQWTAERSMDEADRCAAKYKDYHTKFIDRGYVVYQQSGQKQGYTPMDKKSFSEGIFSDPDRVIFGSIILTEKDPESIRYYNAMNAYGSCVQKNYDSAINKIQKDDFTGKAAVWDRAAGMFQMIGNDKRAQESRDRAEEYRDASGAKSLIDALFEPLPEWLALAGVIGGIFLLHRRRL